MPINAATITITMSAGKKRLRRRATRASRGVSGERLGGGTDLGYLCVARCVSPPLRLRVLAFMLGLQTELGRRRFVALSPAGEAATTHYRQRTRAAGAVRMAPFRCVLRALRDLGCD
jgi:hypothetical protein